MTTFYNEPAHYSPTRQTTKSRHSQHDQSFQHPAESSFDSGGLHRVSLAHELAAAMMPEPTLTSKMLAEEFGLDFDEGAEEEDTGGGDELGEGSNSVTHSMDLYDAFQDHQEPHTLDVQLMGGGFGHVNGNGAPIPGVSMADEDIAFGSGSNGHLAHELDASFGSSISPRHDDDDSLFSAKQKALDPLELLASNLQATDVFIAQLRRVDQDQGSSGALSNASSPLEGFAAAIIGRLNDMAREREQQVRVLLDCERELRKIDGEVGGADLLGGLDELEHVEGLAEPKEEEEDRFRTPTTSRFRTLDSSHTNTPSQRKYDRRQYDPREEDESNRVDDDLDEEENGVPSSSSGHRRQKSAALPLHASDDIPTTSSSVKQMAYFRSMTQSLSVSLTTLSEHAQVNGVNTADAGRKLRALKNKIGDLKADFDTADKSRSRIEQWEAGELEDLTAVDEAVDDGDGVSPSSSPGPATPSDQLSSRVRRVDGRKLVEEQLRGFRLALDEAALKTEAIMAR